MDPNECSEAEGWVEKRESLQANGKKKKGG